MERKLAPARLLFCKCQKGNIAGLCTCFVSLGFVMPKKLNYSFAIRLISSIIAFANPSACSIVPASE